MKKESKFEMIRSELPTGEPVTGLNFRDVAASTWFVTVNPSKCELMSARLKINATTYALINENGCEVHAVDKAYDIVSNQEVWVLDVKLVWSDARFRRDE